MRYIGCKTLLLENIKEVIDDNVTDAEIFCDAFSGTSTVARYFKQWYKVYSNDLLYFSYVLQMATVKNDSIPNFKILNKKGITDPIEYLNSVTICEMEKLNNAKRFFQNNYSPKGGRMYLNDENALRIDFSRNKVEEWLKDGVINENEYFYLVGCIVEGIPFVSNISGTYGAYHKKWDKRSFKKFELFRLPVNQNNKQNQCFNDDAVELLKKISGDILYIDPPYNSRQYLPNYHVLETSAKYDFPELKGVTGQRNYDNNKSDFCQKRKVKEAFTQLINNAKFKHIILSYSSDGLMNINELQDIMIMFGKPNTFKIYEIPYRRYKSRKQGEKEELKEFLFYVEKEV